MLIESVIWLTDCLANHASPAVVPSLIGPLHSLMLLFPQILLGLVLVLDSLTSPSAWREAAMRLWETMRTKPLKAIIWLCLLVAIGLSVWWLLAPVQQSIATPSGLPVDESWPTFHATPSRCGIAETSDARVPAASQLRWTFHDSRILERRPFACSPAIAGSRVLIGSDNYKLYCVDTETGQLQWDFEAQYPIFSSPAVWNGYVYIGEGLHYDANTSLYCLDLNSGHVIWSFQTGSHTDFTKCDNYTLMPVSAHWERSVSFCSRCHFSLLCS